MKLHTIDTGFFKLDGGAMFGVVPKSLWNKANPADENNLCTWAMRCLLIDTGERRILIDNGIGDKQNEKFFGHYDLHGTATLLGSLRALGYEPEDITDNLLTHLHFDHCGGGIRRKGEGFEAVFPNAKYHVGRTQWELALNPNPREKASFLKENLLPMQELGVLNLIENDGEWLPGINLHFIDGHTDGMIVPEIKLGEKNLWYMADLIPSSHHVAMPWVMAYDTRPLLTMKEKSRILEKAVQQGDLLFYEHDPLTEVSNLEETERGIRVQRRMSLAEAIG